MPTTNPLGFDNYSLRALGWNADQLLDHAVRQQFDYLFLSDLNVFPDRSDGALQAFRRRAEAAGVGLHVGTLSVCPGSVLFNPAAGTAADQLRETVRVAAAVGSPIARCVLGRVDDRFSEGGIAARIEETLDVINSVRSTAEDVGVRIAVENHSGDLTAAELKELIAVAGPATVGAVYDLGNTFWALEDPLDALELLAPHVVSTGIRDGMLWRDGDRATLQWTAVGDGLTDWDRFRRRFGELCPGVPLMIETISGRPNPLPGRPEDYPAPFLRLLDRGAALAPGPHADATYQQQQLERSHAFLRRHLRPGSF